MNTINRNVIMILAAKNLMYDWIKKTFPVEPPVSIPLNPFGHRTVRKYLSSWESISHEVLLNLENRYEV